jgi:phosphosulfolactate synthase (CoM biosynthesis protein A)
MDRHLQLAQEVGATVSSVSTGRVEMTQEQLKEYFLRAMAEKYAPEIHDALYGR